MTPKQEAHLDEMVDKIDLLNVQIDAIMESVDMLAAERDRLVTVCDRKFMKYQMDDIKNGR